MVERPIKVKFEISAKTKDGFSSQSERVIEIKNYKDYVEFNKAIDATFTKYANDDFGEQMKKARIEKRITIRKLKELTGCNMKSLCDIEQKKVLVNDRVKKTIMDAINNY